MDEHKAVISYSSDREYETFSGWTKTFTDPRLWAAIVDRLPFKGLSPKRAQTPRWPAWTDVSASTRNRTSRPLCIGGASNTRVGGRHRGGASKSIFARTSSLRAISRLPAIALSSPPRAADIQNISSSKARWLSSCAIVQPDGTKVRRIASSSSPSPVRRTWLRSLAGRASSSASLTSRARIRRASEVRDDQ